MTLHLGPAEGDAFEANREMLRAARLRGRGVRRAHAARARRCRCRTRASTPSGAARNARCARPATATPARTRGTSGSPQRSRARRRSRRATRSRRARCARCSSRCATRRSPRTTCTAASTIVQLSWDELERRFGRALTIRRHLRADRGGEDRRRDVARRARRRASIVSADSRQVYRGFDIGTAKPTADERARVPHLGIDVVDPTERSSAACVGRVGRRWIDEARRAGRTPLVVGGTGFYLRALFGGLFEEPPLDARPSCRARGDARRAAGRRAAALGDEPRSRARASRPHAAHCAPSRSRCSRAVA